MRIEGIVVHGKHIGRTIGFPTANIQVEQQLGGGPDGVYAAFLEVNGVRHSCMVNIGHHPTLPEGGKTVEAHLLDHACDLYGERVALETAAFIRPEQRFASVEALRMQLEQDKITARTLLEAQIQAPPGIE